MEDHALWLHRYLQYDDAQLAGVIARGGEHAEVARGIIEERRLVEIIRPALRFMCGTVRRLGDDAKAVEVTAAIVARAVRENYGAGVR